VGIIALAAVPSSQTDVKAARYMVTSWAVFAILIATAYSSNLVSHLTVPMYSQQLDSIEDLVRADICWTLPYYPNVEDFFDTEVSIQEP
jgi:hypothetical protein